MSEREKVIKGLECCTQHGSMCGLDCNGHYEYSEPDHKRIVLVGNYRESCSYGKCETGCVKTLARDALALLEAQAENSACTKERCPMNASTISDDCNIVTCPWRTEALIPRPSMIGLWYECPACGRHLTKDLDNYCARCGKRVKWK